MPGLDHILNFLQSDLVKVQDQFYLNIWFINNTKMSPNRLHLYGD